MAFPLNLTRDQLIDGLVNEWEQLCHDCPEDDDATPEERRVELEAMSDEELVKEADRDQEDTEDWESFRDLYINR